MKYVFITPAGQQFSQVSDRMEYVSELTIIHERGTYEDFPAMLSNANIGAANQWIHEGYTMITPERGAAIVENINKQERAQ